MAGKVEATGGTGNIDPAAGDSTTAGAREIPSDRNIYSQSQVTTKDAPSEGDAEFDEALGNAAVSYLAVEVFNMAIRGAQESKRLQDEVHRQMKEAEAENEG